MLPAVVGGISGLRRESATHLTEFLDANGEPDADDEGARTIYGYDYVVQYRKLLRRFEALKHTTAILSHNAVIALVSQFDVYLGQLIRGIFFHKPEILNGSAKTFSYAQLVRFDSLDAAREHVIEKEVETILRESHADQFSWLEKSLGISLRNPLPIWPNFIEVTQRRNLFVHTDGVVSSQYLAVCDEHQVSFETRPKFQVGSSAPYWYFC